MEEHEIITMLSLVGEELQAFGLQQPIRILLVGGAYMLTQIHNRSVTQDVDVIVQSVDPASWFFQQAVSAVASYLKISRSWLSLNMAEFFQSIGAIPSGTHWFTEGMLEVYIPDARYVLALKMITGRGKDLNDIEALLKTLEITDRKQVERWLKHYLDEATREEYHPEIETTLAHFFE